VPHGSQRKHRDVSKESHVDKGSAKLHRQMRNLDVLINDINWLISAWNWYVSACGAAGEAAAAEAGVADAGAAEAASTVVSAIS
jgi:hypothetical protein